MFILSRFFTWVMLVVLMWLTMRCPEKFRTIMLAFGGELPEEEIRTLPVEEGVLLISYESL